MTESNSLSVLGDLTKPATVLVEKISDAVGGIFRPYQIVRVARAEAEAALIHAQSDAQVLEVQRRAIHRLLEEEGKKQENMEAITRLALPQLEPEAKPEAVDNDWIVNFFDKCRLTSDADIQVLWSRVLAGEASSPGTFSRRTINFLASLEKSDAELFTTLCSFGWTIVGSSEFVPLIFDPAIDIYTSSGIDFAALSHLDSIGLIRFEPLGFRRVGFRKRARFLYFHAGIELGFPQEANNALDIGHVELTQIGRELARISGAEPNNQFFEYVTGKWKKEGFFPPPPSPNDTTVAG